MDLKIIRLLEEEGDWKQVLCYTFARLPDQQGRNLLRTILTKMLEKESSIYHLYSFLEYCSEVVCEFWFELFVLHGNHQAFLYAMDQYSFGEVAFEKLFSIHFEEGRFKLILGWLTEEQIDIFEILHQSGPDSSLMSAMRACSIRSKGLLRSWLAKHL